MTDVTIRANGAKNSQVTAGVKKLLYRWLEEHGFPDASERIVCHHYREGEFVALSDTGTSKSDRFDELRQELVEDHPENRITSDTCVWVSRMWVSERM
jgi:hypothetical protein